MRQHTIPLSQAVFPDVSSIGAGVRTTGCLVPLATALLVSGCLCTHAPAPPPPVPAAPACATPTAAIEGPTSASAGELVVLDASRSAARDFAWKRVGAEGSFLVVDAGKRCVFSSATPGTYTFILGVAQADRVALAEHTVTVASSPRPPGPGPDPKPPGPDLPDGKHGLARLARDWAGSLVQLPPPVRVSDAQSLASSFEALAAAAAAGTIPSVERLLADTRTHNNAFLQERRSAWQPWSDELAKTLEAKYRAGSLRTVADFADAWREIALGLSHVKED